MKTVALLMLVVAASRAYGAADMPDAQSLEKAMTEAAAVLAERTDADSLAAAALLIGLTDGTRAEQLAGRASAAAPKRTDLLWLHARLCQDVPGCDPKPIDARLHALDPENGAVFLPALKDVAGGAGGADAKQADRLIAALAASKRIDFYWNPLISHVAAPVIATKAMAPGIAVVTVIGAASSVVIPPVAGASLPCRDWIPREERRTECKAIARAFLAGDTSVAEAAGQSMTQALWPPDSPEVLAATEARRTMLYQVSTNGTEAARRLTNEASVQRYLDKLARYRREREVIVAELVEAGHSPTPPAGWRPSPPPGPPPKEAFGPATR
jgi:hypothetical protein